MTSDLLSGPARAAPQGSFGREGAAAPVAAGVSGRTAQATAPLLLILFVISVLPPIYFNLGDTRLSLTRIFLLLSFLPLAFQLFSGKVGKVRWIDIFLVLFCVWLAFTILYHQGINRIPLAAISVVELLGGYLVGRTLIRNATDYRLFLVYLLWAQLFLLPFAIFEFFTNINLLHNFFGILFETFEKSRTQTWRNGYARVISGFEHPILFGLFCAITVAPFFYLYRDNVVKALCCGALPFGMTYLSLSSAPLITAGLCTALILWDYVTKSQWKLLLWLFGISYVFLTIASNRGPVIILIDNLTFNAHTAWTRIWIYEYGSAAVMQNPLLGIGLGDWDRPAWLTGSVDNFWLVIAMRHGLTGLVLLGLALLAGIWMITRTKNLDRTLAAWRSGYVIALVGLYFSLATVHIWGDTSSFLMCFIGAGMWFCTAGGTGASELPTGNTRPALPARRGELSVGVPVSALAVPDTGSRALPTTRFAHRNTRGQQVPKG